eukprot:CAMPEP_0169422100 /NCGR_PEP_ID=MMETSP1017-20121227/66695_1 /TAXON_ID=342587 /ORGANISM="Karlodinium micrum, Strain CCMP2283" /LENGTH=61 /DNA_ID=CAMNT_0009531531 /DNA_START=77 /DNA_END=259 /DNA_ORIENTATION=+
MLRAANFLWSLGIWAFGQDCFPSMQLMSTIWKTAFLIVLWHMEVAPAPSDDFHRQSGSIQS